MFQKIILKNKFLITILKKVFNYFQKWNFVQKLKYDKQFFFYMFSSKTLNAIV